MAAYLAMWVRRQGLFTSLRHVVRVNLPLQSICSNILCTYIVEGTVIRYFET